MIRKYLVRALFATFLIFESLSASSQLNKQAAKNLIIRILPKQADHFEVAYIPKEGNKDVFELESKDGKVILRGNNGVSVASALNYYLRYYCHCLITWNGVNLKLPEHLPVINKKIHKTSPYHKRYYLNYCTFNYTMSWWDWDRWQREIDWMALNGINMPLALTGQNAIWQKVYKQMGFTGNELDQFFSGPAFFAWFWMNNLDAWGGPLPQHWIDTHKALQKKILTRERSLGMTPVLPAFTGHVPPAFSKVFPQANVNKVKWGRNFPAVNILSPEDSLFTILGKKFLKEQSKEYGASHYHSADVFNEMTPPSDDSLYLNNISKKVYQSMYSVDTAAVWVMQGWLFHFNKKFWHSTQIKALLNGVPDNKMILLDLWSEQHPMWENTSAYYGKPWIWNMLHNFGGRIYLGGGMTCVVNQPAALLENSKAGKLAGMGLTMEAIEQNPALYQLMLDNVWRTTPVDLNVWIIDYVHQRYGVSNKEAIQAWKLLLRTVYAHPLSGYGGPKSVITMRPKFIEFKNKKNRIFNYSFDSLLKAWDLLLKASPALQNNDGYQYDLVNTGRQVLADYAVLMEQQIEKAYQVKDIPKLEQLSNQYLYLIDDMDKLLGTRKDFLLGRWLQSAKDWGVTQKEKYLYEFNARDQITLWGNKTSTLHDYARKQWNGLLSGFYKKRWRQFFDYALKCLKNNKPFNQKTINEKMEDWEWNWTHGHEKYATLPEGNPVKISKELFDKYIQVIQKGN